jgi:hypothetical protein
VGSWRSGSGTDSQKLILSFETSLRVKILLASGDLLFGGSR